MSDSSSSRLRLPSKISRPCSAAPQKQTPSPLSPTSTMNSSTVLTEDTDSFIIGDRVWVGGTKPGSIAYIGETQFAPGDWAGVVLDEPIGKNDGSVAGSRYFQCEPKRGIFSRLTRLTRQPLSETTLPTGERTPTSSVYGSRTNLSKSMSTSLHSSVTSLSSVSQKDVTIGDRVIVSSSQGSKAGVLRFMGPTQFASGEWCGVELDEPVGKNDGSVEEIRYFECRPKYGLFAPLHKVSRSPSSRRTSSTCILHKPGGSLMTTPPGRLSGSRESVKSTSSRMSTAGSSAIRGMAPGSREMLKEKQQEIEMLRHERELDRQRISRVAAQADNAERNVITLKEDYDKYKELMELQIHETQTALAQFLLENNSLKVQLEEEKQKNEDLLFRFEEGSINMDDIQVINSQNENKMKDLEKQLTEERARVIRLEQDNSKLLEARDELAKLRAELSTTENSKSQEFQDIQKTHTEASSMLEKQVLERDKLIEQYEKKIQDSEARIRNFESEIVDQTVEQKNLQEKIDVVEKILLEKNGLIEKLRKECEKEVREFQGQIDQLNTMMENLKKENDEKTNSDKIFMEKQLLERDNLIEQLKKQIQDFETKIQSYQSEAAAQTSFHKHLQENINAMEKNLQEKSAFNEKLQKQLELNSKESQREIERFNTRIETITKENAEEKKSLAEQIQQQQNVVESLKKENLATKDCGNILEEKLLEREKLIEKHEKYIGDCEAKIQSFESEVVDQSVLQKNLQDKIGAMNQNVQEKNTLLEKLKKDYDVDLENSKKQIEELIEEIKKIKEQNVEDKKLLVEKIEQEKAMTEKMAKESIEQKIGEYQVLEKQLTEENEKQMEEFKAKLEKSETEVAAQTAIQKSLHEKIEALERDLLEKNTFVEKLQRENEVNGKKYQNEIQQLNEMIEKITTQSIETKNSENIVLQKQLLESKKLMEEKETKIQDYEANIEKYRIDAEAQRGAQQNLQRSIEAMQQNLLEKETLMENLKKESDVSSEASQSLIEQLKNMIESITKKSNDEKESLVEQIEEKQKIIENVTKEIENERKSLTERIEQLETKIETEKAQRDEEKKSLVAQIEELKNAMELAARTSDSEKNSLVEQIEQRQALIDNLSKQSTEETKSLVEQMEQLKNTNHKISEEFSEETKSLVGQIDELKKINENLTKESNEEKKALTEQIEQLRIMIETSTKESVEKTNTLAEQIELSKKEVELVTKQKNEEQESLLQKIEELSKMLENATKQISEEKEPLVEEIEELKKKIENMSKESSEEKKSLVDKIQQKENTIESLTKETSEEKKLLSLEIEQLKQMNEQKMDQNLESQKSLLQKIEDQQNEMESMKKKNTEEQQSLLEQIEQRQNFVENLTKQSSQDKQPLVEQIERLSEMLEKIQEERSIEKNSLIEEHCKKLAEMEESSRSRLLELEDEKSLLQTQTTDRINQIANNYKSLLNDDIEIADIVQLLERKTDDIELIVKELSVRPDKRSAFGRGGENVEESSSNVQTDEKQTLESKIPSVLKKPEKSLKGMDKGPCIPDDEALQSGPKICDDLEKRILLLQGECQSLKIQNLDKQVVEMRKSIEGMKKNFAILLAEEKKLQKSIAVKNADLEKLGAAMNVIEREKHGAGANVDFANTLEQKATRGTKGNSLQSVVSKENLLMDFEDKTTMESLAGSEIAVKELRERFLEFAKTMKKNKNAESLASVGLRETESSMRKLEEIVKNSQKCFAEKMKERSKLSNELHAQIHLFKSTLKGLTSVLNEKNNFMEVTANSSENILSQSESNAKRFDELDHNELEQLLADNETYKGQIEFLNSVIVDMQKKNETLTCKIEVLQLGVPANEADDYDRSTLSKRLTAPRMFCDICDQFDLHETEDCSRQAQDYEQPEPTKNSPKKLPVERPYCENCECFGHDTSECDNSETY